MINIFKRNKDKVKAKTWNDISLKQFKDIKDILDVEDEYMVYNLMDYIYGIDSTSIPVCELSKYKIAFLNENIPEVKLKKYYTLNGRKYDSNFDLTVVTAGQFVDYQQYSKDTKPEANKLLSVFFVPYGHTYNDGYDMQQVQDDLLELDMPTIQSAAFFFERQLQVFVSLFQYYLTKSLKEMKMDEEKKNQLIEELSKVDLADLVSFHSY